MALNTIYLPCSAGGDHFETSDLRITLGMIFRDKSKKRKENYGFEMGVHELAPLGISCPNAVVTVIKTTFFRSDPGDIR